MFTTYYVDEAGDGVIFDRKGRNRLEGQGSQKFFMLGMVSCSDDTDIAKRLASLREELLSNPLYRGIPSMSVERQKTARFFHAKDDHPEVRARVFEILVKLDFKFFAVVKDMRRVLEYVSGRNEMHDGYRYHPNELYDLTVRMLFKQRLHKADSYTITFSRRGKSDRTRALREQLLRARERFCEEHGYEITSSLLKIIPSHPWQTPCLQLADYSLWALQRCYERYEDRFLAALWPKVSLIQDADDPNGKSYGTFLTRKSEVPDPEEIKNRWI